MRNVKLTRMEKQVEDGLLKGEYVDVDKTEFQKVAVAIAARRKNAVLNIRINSTDLQNLKKKAQKLGLKYQTFISELLHQVAHR